MLFYICKAIAYIPAVLFVYPLKIVGRKNVPSKGRVLFCANHQTLNDPIMVSLHFNRRFYHMAKAPLFKTKFSNWFMRKMGAYPVHHRQNDIEAVKTTLKHLKQDHAMCIFPEGARLNTEEAHDLKNGVVNFALKTNAPIVPAAFIKKTLAFRPNLLIVEEPFNLSEMEQFKDRKIDKELLNEASTYLKGRIHGIIKKYNDEQEEKRLSKVLKRKEILIQRHQENALKKLCRQASKGSR